MGIRRTRALALVAGASLVAAGASVAGTASGASPKLTKVKIGLVAQDASNSVVRLAWKAGLFKKNGIDAQVDVIAPTALRPGVISGDVQFASFGGPTAQIMKLQGAPISYIASYSQIATNQVVARPDINSVRDLRHQPVGTTGPGTQSELFVAKALRDVKLRLGDVQEVKLPNVGNVISAFIAGTIKAFDAGPPLSTQALAAVPGSKVLVDNRKNKLEWPNNVLVGNTKWVKGHQKATVAVIKSILEAVPLYTKNAKLAKQNLQEEQPTPLDPAALDAAYKSAVGVFTQKAITSRELEQRVISSIHLMGGEFAKLGTITDARTMMDTTYVKQAMAQLGVK